MQKHTMEYIKINELSDDEGIDLFDPENAI